MADACDGSLELSQRTLARGWNQAKVGLDIMINRTPIHAFRDRRPHQTALLICLIGIVLAGGCGKPPAADGQYGDFPVTAVVAPAKVMVLEDKISLVGSLNAINAVDLVSEIDARVEEILFDEGEAVQQGDVLFRLEQRKLSATVAQTTARYKLARTNLERAASLLQRQTISQQDYDQAAAEFEAIEASLELEKERLADATLIAPFSGMLGEHFVSRGQFTTRGQLLASLVSIDPIEVEFYVPERYCGQLKTGQSIDISVEAYPGQRFDGLITFISPKVDLASRTVLVKARLSNPEAVLKPGMFGNLELVFTLVEDALVIPEAALQFNRDQASVVLMDGDGKAVFRDVEVGARLPGYAQIVSGLIEGDQVVVEGYQKMRPGSAILISDESDRFPANRSVQTGA